MFNEIYELIKKYQKIRLARHIGADPDAVGSTIALKNSILLTFPSKDVKLLGTGSNRFSYFGKFDKSEEISDNTLLIVCDTPDIKRIDGVDDINKFSDVIKIDHHPFIEKFKDNSLEYIDINASSASGIILELINETPLLMDEEIASQIFWGIISDTNRFMFNNSSPKTFHLVGDLISQYHLNINKLYEPLYLRPLEEIRLEGYIACNMEVTENGVGYIKITDKILNEYKTDAAAPGNMIGNFNYIDKIYVWIFITEDVKNENYRISIRSRGPIINKVAEKYHGGGHNYASGARITDINEADLLIKELDDSVRKYLNKEKEDGNNED